LVAHISFYGLVWIVALYLWPKIAKLLRQQGFGVILCALGTIALTLESESRTLMFNVGILFPFVIKAMDQFSPPTRFQLVSIAALSLLLSRFWFPLIVWDALGQSHLQVRYLVNHGPWMTRNAWLLFATAALIAWGVVHRLYFSPLARKEKTS